MLQEAETVCKLLKVEVFCSHQHRKEAADIAHTEAQMAFAQILIATRSTGTCFVVPGVLDKVLFEDPHEDGG